MLNEGVLVVCVTLLPLCRAVHGPQGCPPPCLLVHCYCAALPKRLSSQGGSLIHHISRTSKLQIQSVVEAVLRNCILLLLRGTPGNLSGMQCCQAIASLFDFQVWNP